MRNSFQHTSLFTRLHTPPSCGSSLYPFFVSILLPVLAVLMMLSLPSCNIQKRSYRPGYHIVWHKKSDRIVTTNEKPSQAVAYETSTAEETPEPARRSPNSSAASEKLLSDDASRTEQLADSSESSSSRGISWKETGKKYGIALPLLGPFRIHSSKRPAFIEPNDARVKEAPISFVLTYGSVLLAILSSAFDTLPGVVYIVLGLMSLAGFILGIVALAKFKETSNKKGKGLAVASVVWGGLTILYALLLIILFLFFFAFLMAG
jgi:hypothetical protein